MSDASCQTLEELLGTLALPPTPLDPSEEAATELRMLVHALLRQAMDQEDIGVNDLARLVEVSPSAISRSLSMRHSMKLSTFAVLATALKRRILVSLQPFEEVVGNSRVGSLVHNHAISLSVNSVISATSASTGKVLPSLSPGFQYTYTGSIS